MTSRSRAAHHPTWRRRAFAVLLAAAVLSVPVAARQVEKQAAAVQEFQRRLQAYLGLRAAVSKRLQPLSPTAKPGELAQRQEALAAALRAARAGSRPGDLVPPDVAVQIRSAILDDFKRRSAADERAAFSEVPDAPIPAINATYPPDAALPTVPPLLLMTLPRLPDILQYRFYGRHVVLLDSDLQIIVDYIANVLPPH